MKIYAIYYIDEGGRNYFMQREDAQSCGVDYIRQIGVDEGWDPQEIESLVDEFVREEWAYDLCSLEEIEVKE